MHHIVLSSVVIIGVLRPDIIIITQTCDMTNAKKFLNFPACYDESDVHSTLRTTHIYLFLDLCHHNNKNYMIESIIMFVIMFMLFNFSEPLDCFKLTIDAA